MNQKMVFSTERKKRNQEFYVNLKLDKEENKELIVVGESQSKDMDVPENKGGNDLWMIKLK